MIPAEVRAFRAAYRRDRLPWYYVGELHLAFTSAVLLGTIGWHLIQVPSWGWREALFLPATLVFGNAVEYLLHRYPLHAVYPFARPAYEIHTLEHHRFYVHGAMDFESVKDFMMVLFPPWAPVLTALFTTAVGAWVIAPLTSPGCGHAFAAMGTGQLLLYEVLHSLAHCSDDGWAGRLPLVQGIRRHHRLHHDPALMSRYNFNITFPVFDRLLGTMAPEGRYPRDSRSRIRSSSAV